MKGLKATLGFILKNLAVPIGFFITFRAAGAKPAIAFAVGFTCLQLLWHRISRTAPSPFFIVAAGFTVVLGCVDLWVESPRFFRLEPGLQNLVMSAAFVVSIWARKPVVAWFAASLPASVRPRLDADGFAYLHKVTIAWAAYFLVKGLFFLYLATQVNLGRLVLLRSVIGGVSLLVMIGGEIAYRKLIMDRRSAAKR